MGLGRRLENMWGKLQPYQVYAFICFVVTVVLGAFDYFGSAWFAAAITIIALGRQRQFETKAIILATQALLAREQQWREEREVLLRLGEHHAATSGNSRKCTVCGFDVEHPIHRATHTTSTNYVPESSQSAAVTSGRE